MAKTICKLLGVVFLLVGIIGFIKPDLLGTHLTLLHNVVHIVSGIIALYFGFAASLSAARGFALAFGAVYLLLGVVGFIMGDSANDRMLTLIADDPAVEGISGLMFGTADHAVHILIGVVFLAGALLTKPDARAID
ncbi:MAG TPA: DUF4383 domain-containing protein [Pyrinomonadaceae bacterium]